MCKTGLLSFKGNGNSINNKSACSIDCVKIVVNAEHISGCLPINEYMRDNYVLATVGILCESTLQLSILSF